MESSVGADVTHSVQAATASGRACPSPDRRNHRRATTLATYEFYDEQTSGKSFRPNRATRRSGTDTPYRTATVAYRIRSWFRFLLGVVTGGLDLIA